MNKLIDAPVQWSRSQVLKPPSEIELMMPVSTRQHLSVVVKAVRFSEIILEELLFTAGNYTRETIKDAIEELSLEYEEQFYPTEKWSYFDDLSWDFEIPELEEGQSLRVAVFVDGDPFINQRCWKYTKEELVGVTASDIRYQFSACLEVEEEEVYLRSVEVVDDCT